MTRPPHIVKNDDGSDNGYGYAGGGGSGYGSDRGSGRGDGGGNGYGSGSGSTGRWLDTSHPHYTTEWHKLTGGATPYKALP